MEIISENISNSYFDAVSFQKARTKLSKPEGNMICGEKI
jgi:hypothetical protein